jgi:spore germination protein
MGQAKKLQRYLLFLAFILMTMSGCYDSEDIDRRIIVNPIGVDLNSDGRLLLTIRSPVAKQNQEGSSSYISQRGFITRSALAKGIFPAFLDIQGRYERTLFVGQCRSVVFGEALAKRGLKPHLDFFNRLPTFPPNAYIMVAKPSAEKILKTNWAEQEIQKQNMRWFFTSRANRVFGIKRWTLFRDVYDPLEDPMVPIVSPSDRNSTVKLVCLAVFRDDRMVGEVKGADLRLLGMLMHIREGNRLVIPSDNRVPTSFRMVIGRKKVKALYLGHPRFEVSLKLKAFVGELDGYREPINEKEIKSIEAYSARYLQKKISSLLHKLQAMGSDPLEFGNIFRIQQPRYFSLATWPLVYKQADFHVSVKVFIERLGVLK